MDPKKFGSHMHKRSGNHDYKAPGNYLFTIKKSPEAPEFCRITGSLIDSTSEIEVVRECFYFDFSNRLSSHELSDREVTDKKNAWRVHCRSAVEVDLTNVGKIIDESIAKIESLHPEWFDILKYVIMPDHIHILIRVRCYLPKPVTDYVGLMKSISTSNFKKACAEEQSGQNILPVAGQEFSLFETGINDKIIYDEDQFRHRAAYVADNPRRYLIKKSMPELFSSYKSIRVMGRIFDSLGNIFLLKAPDVKPVHMRRHWLQWEREAHAEECLAHAAEGGVLISPFFNPDEAKVMHQALESGGKIIKLRMEGFSEREKPVGKEFEYCSRGQLLLLAESGSPTKRQELKYEKARHLNLLAAEIAATPAEGRQAAIRAAKKR